MGDLGVTYSAVTSGAALGRAATEPAMARAVVKMVNFIFDWELGDGD